MKILGIIPARYASSRLPGKPLAQIEGKPMIQWVYERASSVLSDVVVATDDIRVADAVKSFNGEVIMTSPDHQTGTNRCLEALEKHHGNFDIVINIQGDEPLLEPAMLELLAECFEDPNVRMASLASKVENPLDLNGDSSVFVTLNDKSDALYFSRFPIPFCRGESREKWLQHHDYFRHIGLYAYTPDALSQFAAMPVSSLEKTESLEQLRWLQAGENIRISICSHPSPSVDTAEDLEQVRKLAKSL